MKAIYRFAGHKKLAAWTSILLLCVAMWPRHYVLAATLSNRSIVVPTALTGSTTNHEFRFSYASSDSVGSVSFEYCDNSPLDGDPCSAPADLDVSNVTLNSQSGQTGFSMHSSTTTNRIVITRPSLSVIPGAASYTFGSAVNPTTANKTIFVRINTHGNTDGTGATIDTGAVAFTLTGGLAVNAFVPPFLTLCAGVTVATDCSTATGLGINLGILSPTQASTGTTQVAAATNDNGGYALSMQGLTMTSGNNTISALSAPTISSPATSQFGVNARANNVPSIGHDPEGSGSAIPTTDYNQPNLFTFRGSDTLANSAMATDFNRFTISYLVNIPFGQPPGVYSTTITYIAVASF